VLLKVILINTETIGPTFIAKVYRESALNINDLPKVKKKNSNKTPIVQSMTIMKSNINKATVTNNQVCVILTNNSFIIKNFTANALALLGLNSNYMNSSVDICVFIKQIHEELFKFMEDCETTFTSEEKIALKRQIVLSKFKSPTLIEWKTCDGDPTKYKGTKTGTLSKEFEDEMASPSFKKKSIRTIFTGITPSNLNNPGLSYYLTVFEATIGGKQEGYIFLINRKPKYTLI
jgi:hypothetical protein